MLRKAFVILNTAFVDIVIFSHDAKHVVIVFRCKISSEVIGSIKDISEKFMRMS